MFRILLYNFHIAMEAIMQNKLRSALTSLGIIFGVGSVIAMLAIGKGAQEEILEKMKLLGTNNIIIKAKEVKKETKVGEDESSDEKNKELKKYSPGLTLDDAKSIKSIIPNAEAVSSEMKIELTAIADGIKQKVNVIGADLSFFEINPNNIKYGSLFTSEHLTRSMPVCVIGGGVKSKFFPTANPIGKYIKCGNIWLKVIGALEEKNIKEDNLKTLGIRNYNFDIYTPINTALLRFKNRSLITKQSLKQNDENAKADESYHQIDRIVVKINDSEYLHASADIIKRTLARKHNYVDDYEVIVPEELLKQEQKTRSIFNIVLGSIASISLIVGGIGIMNIMLASVMERIKEIGTRLAVGAMKRDIIFQFLCESVSISLVGGILGIFMGVGLSYAIEFIADIKTIVSIESVALSFFVSISIGIIFGITPARKAALQDPIESLRYE